jgi:carbon-monoxide dehydrogenase medium subunit
MVTFLRPSTLGEASSLVREHEWDAKLVSGGTAVVLMLQQGLIAPSYLVSLGGLTDVPGWTAITSDAGRLRIGGGVTLSAVAGSAVVRALAPSLATAASLVGNARVRNVATLGGNVAEADYASDPPAVLVALGAEIEVTDGTAVRTVAAADMFTDFYSTDLAVGEVITAIDLPAGGAGARSSYTKFCSRSAEDRPCVGVATAVRLRDGAVEDLEVVVGAVAGTPQRWPEVTALAAGQPLGAQVAGQVARGYAAAVDPLEDARGSAWYRRQMVEVLVRRSIEDLATVREARDD